MAFKTVKTSTISLDSPEAMYKDIRPRKIEGLLSQQADVLREYAPHAIDKKDVALQMPTGGGKTLVGVVIAEWRRRKFAERAVYLCPTRQLVHQVAQYANKDYGIRAHAFAGGKKNFDQAAKAEWKSGQAIGIATYDALFNTNPFFADAELIIVDDAHTAENYFIKMWSLRVERYKDNHKSLFEALASCFQKVLSPSDFVRLTREPDSLWDQTWVDLIPMPSYLAIMDGLRTVLDEYIEGTDQRFAWSVLRDHLEACQLYASSTEIMLRPLLPPADAHAPFAGAKQRIFMSATLGEGGELERLTGRRAVHRLPAPDGWDQQGTGRRFFIFPGMALSDVEQGELMADLISEAGRALYLTPNERAAEEVRTTLGSRLPSHTLFTARQIEQSKEPFVTTENAVAVIANRYDGIDFPKDDCRLLIIDGQPTATNLQEKFIMQKMGASLLYHDRVRTRVVQAFGRCTRSATDYSAVVITGDEMLDYLLKREGKTSLHPELQAEIEFGQVQSKEATKEQLVDLFRLFLKQGDEWKNANDEIVGLRNDARQTRPDALGALSHVAPLEVRYVYAMWRSDYSDALECCRQVLDQLHGASLQGYRALWLYLAGSTAFLLSQSGSEGFSSRAATYYGQAAKAAPSVRWLSQLARSVGVPVDQVEALDGHTATLLERIEQMLGNLGMTNDARYIACEKSIVNGLASENTKVFEEAHKNLGLLLGYEAGNSFAQAAPDPWWKADDKLCFVFEDNSNASPEGSLSVEKARQASTHERWIRANVPLEDEAEILHVLVTPVQKAQRGSSPHLGNVYLWPLEDFRQWAKDALRMMRELRNTYSGSADLVWPDLNTAF